MKKLITLLAIVTITIFLLFSYIFSLKFEHPEKTTTRIENSYQKGVNDALEAITLLNLELLIGNKRKTMGEMSIIVRERLDIKYKKEAL